MPPLSLLLSWKYLPSAARQALLVGVACALAAGWFVFAAGIVSGSERVTVTHVIDHSVYETPYRGGPHGPDTPGGTRREYRVECITVRGIPCTVETEALGVYREGELITAEVALMKPAGEFGWTFTSKFFAWAAALAFGLAAWSLRRNDATTSAPSSPTILEMNNTAHADCFAARTHRGWGIVDRAGIWRIPDRYAEIGEVRHVTIDFESIAITLNNEDRWVAAVKEEAEGSWGGIKLEMRPGEEVTKFIFESEAAVFDCLTNP